MRISVVLSTYNAPHLLRRVLHGYARQDHPSFELVIADDGSTGETADLLESARGELGLEIRHVWHEDDGFRKCAILNRAIVASEAPYLVFSDGDCIPRRDFLATHARLARPGRFVSGGYLMLERGVSERLTLEDIATERAFSARYLRELGAGGAPRLTMRLTRSAGVARLLDRLTTTRPTWNGHNASGWRDDLMRANGFDERMRYGGEDRELGERLEHAGIRGHQARHRCVCLHLWHERGYVTDEDLARNRAIRDETAQERRTVTPYGIAQS